MLSMVESVNLFWFNFFSEIGYSYGKSVQAYVLIMKVTVRQTTLSPLIVKNIPLAHDWALRNT